MAHCDRGGIAATAANHTLNRELAQPHGSINDASRPRAYLSVLEHHAELKYSGVLAILVT